MGRLSSAWAALHETLSSVAPSTASSILEGTSSTAIAEAERACPNDWPDELVEYFLVQGGQVSESAGEVIPLHQLLSLDAAMLARTELISRFPPTDDASQTAVAGEAQYYFAPTYIPVAESDGNYLFCDTRAGALRGQLGAFSADAADEDNRWWPSIVDMTSEIATALISSGTVRWYSPHVSGGTLDWSIGDDSARYRAEHDAMHSHYLEHPEGNIAPTEIVHTDGVDLMQVQRDVLAMASQTYGHANLTQIMMSADYLPKIVGRQAVCAVAVQGALRGYTITVADEDGAFTIESPPYL